MGPLRQPQLLSLLPAEPVWPLPPEQAGMPPVLALPTACPLLPALPLALVLVLVVVVVVVVVVAAVMAAVSAWRLRWTIVCCY